MKSFREFLNKKKEIKIPSLRKAIATLLIATAMLSPMKANAVMSKVDDDIKTFSQNQNYVELASAINENMPKDHDPIKITADMIEGAVEGNVHNLYWQNSRAWKLDNWEYGEQMNDAGCFFLDVVSMPQIKENYRIHHKWIKMINDYAHNKGNNGKQVVGRDPRDGDNGSDKDMYVWYPTKLADMAYQMIKILKEGGNPEEDDSWKNPPKRVTEVGRFGPNSRIPAGKDWDFCIVKISSPIRVGKEHFVLCDKNGKVLLDPLYQRILGHSSSLFSVLYPDLPENKNGPNKGKYSEVYLYKLK